MENKFIYSDDNKRYHTWNYHLRHKFGCKVFKVALNGGFTCPNIDGSKGVGGCIYCSGGSGDFAGDSSHSILTQFNEVKEKMHQKWKDAKYIPYFQAHTNTYAPASVLRDKFECVLNQENVVGISVATRADCLKDDVTEYLSYLNKRTYLIVELGLQTIFDETGEKINRCHTYADFLEGYEKLKKHGINNICVHLIDGLPGETTDMMLESAKAVAALKPHCVKLHLLHVLKGTKLAQMYLNGEFELMTLEDYVQTIVNQLEVFPEETIIQRLTGDGGRNSLIGPMWSLKKFVVLNEIDKLMLKRDTYQGAKL